MVKYKSCYYLLCLYKKLEKLKFQDTLSVHNLTLDSIFTSLSQTTFSVGLPRVHLTSRFDKRDSLFVVLILDLLLIMSFDLLLGVYIGTRLRLGPLQLNIPYSLKNLH